MPTFYDRFAQCAKKWPDQVAIEIQHADALESCTYAELQRMAESVGQWITANKFPDGARLAILADNHARWVAAYLGIVASGRVAVPLDTALHADQIAKLLKDAGASVMFCDRKHAALAREAVADAGIGLVLTDPEKAAGDEPSGEWKATLAEIFAGGPQDFRPVEAAPDAVAALLYTSGTTADPKGVMLTHANYLGEVEAVFSWVDMGPGDALLGVLPLFHVLAQMANLLIPLVSGARVVFLETLNTTELLRALRERGITAFAVVPQFFYLIHARIFEEVGKRGALARGAFRLLKRCNGALRKLGLNAGKILFGKVHETLGRKMRYLATGGSRFDPVIARDFYDLGIDVLQAYGLTETAAAVFCVSPKHNVIGSVGRALKGVECKIVNPKPPEDGQLAVGEVALRGAVVMKGYWNRPDATAAVMRDGWFLTGDLGYLDGHGNLFLTGRKKEVIVLSNGKNIYPEEIEAHYLKSAYIKEIAVMGLEGSPAAGGDRLHAVIVPNFDTLRQRKIVNAKEAIRWDVETLSQQIASTKRIGSYEIWQDDLPRTTTRKIKRFEVQKRVAANQQKGGADDALSGDRPLTPEQQSWLDRPQVQEAVTIIRRAARLPVQAISPVHNLELDLGLDSMQRIELLSRLEESLGGNVEESQLGEIYTVRDLVDAVLTSAATGATRASGAAAAGWQTILAEPSTDPQVLSLANPSWLQAAFWFVISRVAKLIAIVFCRLRVRGLENVPAHGPYLLCSNHQGYLDPLVLCAVLPWRVFSNLFSVGTSEIFGQGLMLRLAHSLRVIVVDPDANLVPAMRAGAFGLKHGMGLILYPEGERSIDGSPKVFKKGAAILSIHMQAPIVPIAIDGFFEMWPRGKGFQGLKPAKIVFGDLIHPPPESEASEAAYDQLTAEVKARVVEMWNALRSE